MTSDGIWITWEKQRRNSGLSSALGFKLFEFEYDKHIKIVRYLIAIYKTTHLIFKNRSKIIVTQNPSIVLSLLAVFLKKLFHFKLVIDAHNSGLYPMEGKNTFFMTVSRFIQRNSTLTIVTNEKLKEIVKSNGGMSFVLQDKIPEIESASLFPMDGIHQIACICTYGDDEPYREIIEAAQLIPEEIVIYFTGNYKNKVDRDTVPSNVKLLGYISEKDYWSLLNSVDVVMDLTLRENCLVCGAYEGLSLLKPMVLSNTEALKSYFSKGCTYVNPDSASIAFGITDAIDRYAELKNEIVELKYFIDLNWNKRLSDLEMLISDL